MSGGWPRGTCLRVRVPVLRAFTAMLLKWLPMWCRQVHKARTETWRISQRSTVLEKGCLCSLLIAIQVLGALSRGRRSRVLSEDTSAFAGEGQAACSSPLVSPRFALCIIGRDGRGKKRAELGRRAQRIRLVSIRSRQRFGREQVGRVEWRDLAGKAVEL